MFSGIMLIIMVVGSDRVGKIVNEGLFFSKFVITIAIFFITLQFSNDFITNYSNFAQIFSYIFIVWQVTMH